MNQLMKAIRLEAGYMQWRGDVASAGYAGRALFQRWTWLHWQKVDGLE